MFKNKYIKRVAYVLAGLLLGWLLFHRSAKSPEVPVAKEQVKPVIWTCAMHPQIRREEPGQCPICGMELIPLTNSSGTVNPEAVQIDEAAAQIARVQTSVITRQEPVKEIRLYGKVQADERLVQTLPAHIPGRIENLSINFTGENITKNQVVAMIYSPELITAQQELIEASAYKQSNPSLVEAAREKLRHWKLSESQIAEIEQSGKIKHSVEVRSTINGTVVNRKVNVGDYVQQGQPLYEVVDLHHIWVIFDAYENDLQWIHPHATITFTIESLPGQSFSGEVSFIDPVINPQTRVAGVRIEVNNSSGLLKPDMFTTGILRSVLGNNKKICVPKSAVLWTGKRSVVYTKDTTGPGNAFIRREVTLGPEVGDSYVVSSGLHEGDIVVTNGTFAIDAAAQLSGKPSMMNQEDQVSQTRNSSDETSQMQ